MDIKERIKHAMAIREVNQTELAKMVGVSHQAVQKWLSSGDGGTTPRMSKLKKIAESLQVSESWLTAGVGVPDSSEAKKETFLNELKLIMDEMDNEQLKMLLEEVKKLPPNN